MVGKLALLAFLITTLSTSVSAKDYGTYGALFPIIEPSILDTINERLEEMQAAGELDQMQKEFEATTRAYVTRPKPVLGLQKHMSTGHSKSICQSRLKQIWLTRMEEYLSDKGRS